VRADHHWMRCRRIDIARSDGGDPPPRLNRARCLRWRKLSGDPNARQKHHASTGNRASWWSRNDVECIGSSTTLLGSADPRIRAVAPYASGEAFNYP
jgi:hypothetical protein